MITAPSTSALLFWSWVNQSQNAAVNYFNRNASSPMTNTMLATSYGVAVTSSLAVAFGLATFIQKRFPHRATQLLKFVAFPSAVIASSLNCYIVRYNEMNTGVPLWGSPQGDVVSAETSKIAATQGTFLEWSPWRLHDVDFSFSAVLCF
jgi:sideroflexin-5